MMKIMLCLMDSGATRFFQKSKAGINKDYSFYMENTPSGFLDSV